MGFLIVMLAFVVLFFFVVMFIGMVIGGGQYAAQIAREQQELADQQRNQGQ